MNTLYNWHIVEGYTASAMEEARISEVDISGKLIALLKKDNTIHAFAATCPHAGARLCDGWLDMQGRIVCPLHKYRFDPANGRNTSGEGYKLRTYPVEVRNDHIFVGLIA